MKNIHWNLMFYMGCVLSALYLLTILSLGAVVFALAASVSLITYYPAAGIDYVVSKFKKGN